MPLNYFLDFRTDSSGPNLGGMDIENRWEDVKNSWGPKLCRKL